MRSLQAQSPIAIISSMATDTLMNRQGEILAIRDGGPAKFIQQTLATEGIDCRLYVRDRLQVPILVTDKGEFGKVLGPVNAHEVRNEMFQDWTILSTIAGEWRVSEDLQFPDHLFVDAQGFVRDPSNFGSGKRWGDIEHYINKIFCLKATNKEAQYIPSAVLEDQKQNRMLLITKGAFGVEVYNKGTLTRIQPARVVQSPDTIGAGDTFLACFVAGLWKGCRPSDAATQAAASTIDFLESKRRS